MYAHPAGCTHLYCAHTERETRSHLVWVTVWHLHTVHIIHRKIWWSDLWCEFQNKDVQITSDLLHREEITLFKKNKKCILGHEGAQQSHEGVLEFVPMRSAFWFPVESFTGFYQERFYIPKVLSRTHPGYTVVPLANLWRKSFSISTILEEFCQQMVLGRTLSPSGRTFISESVVQ